MRLQFPTVPWLDVTGGARNNLRASSDQLLTIGDSGLRITSGGSGYKPDSLQFPPRATHPCPHLSEPAVPALDVSLIHFVSSGSESADAAMESLKKQYGDVGFDQASVIV